MRASTHVCMQIPLILKVRVNLRAIKTMMLLMDPYIGVTWSERAIVKMNVRFPKNVRWAFQPANQTKHPAIATRLLGYGRRGGLRGAAKEDLHLLRRGFVTWLHQALFKA